MRSDLTTRLRALHVASGTGEWRRSDCFRADSSDFWYVTTDGVGIVCRTSTCFEADAIIAAHNALPALCDAADERDALRAQHERDTALCAQAAEDVANMEHECVRQLATATAERDAARRERDAWQLECSRRAAELNDTRWALERETSIRRNYGDKIREGMRFNAEHRAQVGGLATERDEWRAKCADAERREREALAKARPSLDALALALGALREALAALPAPVDGVTPPLDATRATGLALGLAAAVAMVERVAGEGSEG